MKYAKIQPITIYSDGIDKQANILIVKSNQDDLYSFANFEYMIGEGNETDGRLNHTVLISGNVPIFGSDYTSWDGSNDYAYFYIASKLGLTIISE